MSSTPTGIVVPAGSDPFDPQGDMVDLANSLRSRIIVPVTNKTARAALAAAIGWVPTVGEPLRVSRADAPDGARLEYTEDGTTWRTLPMPGAWADIPLTSGYQPYAAGYSRPQIRRVGDEIEVSSGIVGYSSSAALTAGTIYTINNTSPLTTDLAPESTIVAEAAILHYGGVPTFAEVRVTSAGAVIFIPGSSGTLTGTTTSWLGIPAMRWPARTS
jgi:hypothetical protein